MYPREITHRGHVIVKSLFRGVFALAHESHLKLNFQPLDGVGNDCGLVQI